MIGARSEAGGRPGREDMAAKDVGGAISVLCLVPLPTGESTQHGGGSPCLRTASHLKHPLRLSSLNMSPFIQGVGAAWKCVCV